MKVIFAFLAVLTCVSSMAQDLSEKISKLKSPTSPASIIIGNQPATISKPKSWQALEAAIYSNYTNQAGGLVIPNDYAIEFTPYWIRKEKNISFDEFVKPNPWQSAMQNLSFSISSTKNFLIKDSVKTDALGLGIRTMIWLSETSNLTEINNKMLSIRDKANIAANMAVLVLEAEEITNTWLNKAKTEKSILLNRLMQALVKRDGTKDSNENFDVLKKLSESSDIKQTADSVFISQLTKYLQDRRERISRGSDNNELEFFKKNKYEDWMSKFIKELKSKLPQRKKGYLDEVNTILDDLTKLALDAKDLENIVKDRDGFKLEMAAALSLNFPTNKTDFSYAPKYSIWLTPSYQLKGSPWEFLAVIKYTHLYGDFYKRFGLEKDYFDSNFDYGARIVHKWNKFSAELELISRSSRTILEKTKDANGIITEKIKTGSDFQYLLNLNYRISDTIILSYNFGSQFKPTASSINSLISLATLNFGIGGPIVNDLVKAKN